MSNEHHKQANAFISPEMNNDFVGNLRNERIFSSEVSYQYIGSWLLANFSAYYNHLTHVTEWQNFYFDRWQFIYLRQYDWN